MRAGPEVTLRDATDKHSGAQLLRPVGAEAAESALPRSIDRYTLHEEIAFGGVGAVHLGLLQGAAGFFRPVAIKRLHAHLEQGPATDELRQEAWLGSHVRHPNVVPVLDLVEANGRLFLVMEFVLGETLARLRPKNELMPVPVAVAILADVLQGLHAAHIATGRRGGVLGIVHRDVSPQNILVGMDGIARILDFGVAKCTAEEERFGETTEVGFFKGKLGYFAPEQLLSDPLDARTDIFAAGVVLWEALTGRRLFKGVNPTQALLRAEQGIPPPSAYNRDVTPRLDAVVACAMQRHPQFRFQSAAQFAEQLQSATARAPAGQVGRYVEKAAAAAIGRQRSLLRRIHAPERVIVSREPAPDIARQAATTAAFATHPFLEPPGTSRRGTPWSQSKINTAVGVGVLLIAGTIYGFCRRPERSMSPEPPAQSAVRLVAPAAAIAAGPVEPSTAIAISSLPSAPAPSRPGKTSVRTSTQLARKHRATSVPSSCRPPYLVDSDGIKRIKRGCL
jgi:eukaryotic-like serine/threonine-protein kinase